MDISTNYGFFLPSRDTDDIADINQISDNFRIIDGKMVEKVEGKGLSENDYTAQDKEKVQGALQRNQGTENAGKFMSVDENGNVVPSIAVKESLENKQDKFAEMTERDGILTLIAGRELHLESIDSSKDFSGWLKLLYGTAELNAYGTVTVKSSADDVKLSGRRAVDDSANINADDCRIRNLANPVFEKDAVNKSYLDGVIGDIERVLDELHNYAQALINGGKAV